MTEPESVPLALPPSVRWPLPRVLPVRPSSSGRLFNLPSYRWRPKTVPRRAPSPAGASGMRREADRMSWRRRKARNRALAIFAALLVVMAGIGRSVLGQLTERTADLFVERSRNSSLADSIAAFQVALESQVKRSVVLQPSVRDRPEMPMIGRVSSHFTSSRLHPLLNIWRPHHGVDIAAPEGTLVHPVVQGRVVKVARNFGFGLYVEVDHGSGVGSRYAHLREAHVRIGQLVRPNMTLGKSGSSGFTSGPHLHYEVLKYGRPVDPMAFRLVVLERVPSSIERVAEKPDAGRMRASGLRGDPKGSGSRRGVGKSAGRAVGRGADNGRAAPKPNGAAVLAPRTGIDSPLRPFDEGRFK